MNTNPGIIGLKIGNTQIYKDDGNVARVTVIEAGPVMVVGKRTQEKDGYSALVLGLGERKEKHTTKPMAGALRRPASRRIAPSRSSAPPRSSAPSTKSARC